MEIAEITFAYKRPCFSGTAASAEERESEIGAFLKTVKWIHPGHFVSRRGEPGSVEAVIIIRRPLASTAKASNRWGEFRSWLQKKLPNLFDSSLCSFDRVFEWGAYKIRSKDELLYYYAVNDAESLEKQGYDVQVVLPKVERLHRMALPNPTGIIWPEPETFSSFIRLHTPVARYSLSH